MLSPSQLLGLEGPLKLDYEAVEALYLGSVPSDGDQDPETLSIEPKCG